MRFASLRSRLLGILLLGIGTALVVAGVGLRLTVSRWLSDEFDQSLASKAGALVTLTKQQNGEVELDFADEFMPEFERDVDPEYFELRLEDGTLLEQSRSLAEGERLAVPCEGLREATGVFFRDTELPDGRAGREVEIHFVPQTADGEDIDEYLRPARMGSGRGATLVVARSREELDQRILQLDIATVAVAVMLLLLTSGLAWYGVGFGLRPVAILSREVAELDVGALGRRLDVHGVPAELVPVVQQVNDLLDRIHRSVERERRLSSDLAHELRTPIAELRSVSDVGARWPENRRAVVHFFNDVQEIALQMENTALNLLHLSRIDSGETGLHEECFNLKGLVEGVWQGLPESPRSERVWRCDIPSHLMVSTDSSKLGIALSNLLHNAISYSPLGDAVHCFTSTSAGSVDVAIENTAPELETADLGVMFDRFWRKDSARSDGKNVGLGLAVAKGTAKLLGLQVEAELLQQRLRITVKNLKIVASEGDAEAQRIQETLSSASANHKVTFVS